MTDEKQQKIFTPITQAEAGYVEISPNMPAQACANCRWFRRGYTVGGDFDPTQDYCQLVENTPKDIENVGWCNRWEAPPEPEQPDMGGLIIEADEVTIVEMEAGSKELEEKLAQPGVLERLLKALKNVMGRDSPAKTFKNLGGGLWLAIYSNNFEDREKEIISASAQDAYVKRLQSRLIPMPELWFWHTDTTRHGKALWVDRIGHFMVAVGEYDDTPLAKAMQAHYEEVERKQTKYGLSHGFYGNTKTLEDHGEFKVWNDINTFEISVLPVERAANAITMYELLERNEMASKESMEALQGILTRHMGKDAGEAEMQRITSGLEKANADAEALNKRYKDFTEPTEATEESAENKAFQQLEKGIGEVIVDLIEGQGEILDIQKAAAKENESLKAELATVKAANAELVERLSKLEGAAALAPRSVKQLTEGGTEPTQQQKQHVQEFDPFFGDLGVPTNG